MYRLPVSSKAHAQLKKGKHGLYPREVLTRVLREDAHCNVVCSGRKLENHYGRRGRMRQIFNPGDTAIRRMDGKQTEKHGRLLKAKC